MPMIVADSLTRKSVRYSYRNTEKTYYRRVKTVYVYKECIEMILIVFKYFNLEKSFNFTL